MNVRKLFFLMAVFLVLGGVTFALRSLQTPPARYHFPFTDVTVDMQALFHLGRLSDEAMLHSICVDKSISVILIKNVPTGPIMPKNPLPRIGECQSLANADKLAKNFGGHNSTTVMMGRMLPPNHDCKDGRPHCDRTIILLAKGAGRFDLLHEYAHWLIYEERRRSALAQGMKEIPGQDWVMDLVCPEKEEKDATKEELRRAKCMYWQHGEEIDINRFIIAEKTKLRVPEDEVEEYWLRTKSWIETLKTISEMGFRKTKAIAENPQFFIEQTVKGTFVAPEDTAEVVALRKERLGLLKEHETWHEHSRPPSIPNNPSRPSETAD